MTFYFLILFALYFVLLVVLRLGFASAVRSKKRPQNRHDFFITIIIPIRNEEKNLGALLRSLSDLHYPSSTLEVIFVNDHSTDGSVRYLDDSRLPPWITVISLDERERGKKAALAGGVDRARGEIIVTTDADCLLPPDWLTAINAAFQDDRVKMVPGIVSIAEEGNFFSRWQVMEFASVMGTGVAAFGLNRPMMCNGANLSFRKEVFHEVKGYEGNEDIPSGDDEFLMRKITARYPDSLQVLYAQDAIVITQGQPTIADFLQQRIRWASKWKRNSDVGVRLFAFIIFLVQASWIYFFVAAGYADLKIVFAVAALKFSADLVFLLPVFSYMKIKFRLIPFLGLQFLYPFYVIFVGLLAPWASYRWKERKIL